MALIMTPEEKAVFLGRPDVAKEKAAFMEYVQLLKSEADAMYDGKIPTEDFYCMLRGALGFDDPNMRDKRAPNINLLKPHILGEIERMCKKPRKVMVDGHLITPQAIPNFNEADDLDMIDGGYRPKRHVIRRSKKTRRNVRKTRKNHIQKSRSSK